MHPFRFCLVRVAFPTAALFAVTAGYSLTLPAEVRPAAVQNPSAASPLVAATDSQTPSATTLSVLVAGSPVTSIKTGTAVTLTAQVTSQATHAAVAPGLILFCDATAAHCEDTAILGTAQLTGNGTASFQFVPSLGPHRYQAIFAGTHAVAKSSSAGASLTVTGKHSTVTTLTSSGPLDDLLLTATVSGAGLPAPTGTVTFTDTTGATRLGTASLGSAARADIFSLQSFNSADYYAYPSLLVDLNGDGIKDLVRIAVETGPTNFLKLQLGNGDGTFRAPTILYTGFPSSVVAGDFNADGIVDLALGGNYKGQASVTVLLGQGSGTFKAQPPVALNGTYIDGLSLVAADVNGDGIADLVVGIDSTLTVLLGTASGTFIPQPSTTIPYTIASLSTADFNNDGLPDLVVINQEGGAGLYLDTHGTTFAFAGGARPQLYGGVHR